MAATRKTDKKADGFTAEERPAMKERTKEAKAAKGAKKVDGTYVVVGLRLSF